MTTRPIYKVDAFTQIPLQGNPAAVMPFAQGMTKTSMMAVAREMNISETAFVLPSSQADFRIRFFTSTQEIPFCGNALVATLKLLEELGAIQMEGDFARVKIETGAGVFPADLVLDSGSIRVDMTQATPAFRPFTQPADRLLEILGAHHEDLREDLPIELAFTGLWHLLVPFSNIEALDGLLPDFRALAALNRELGALTTHIFVEEQGIFHCRDFAPAAGVDEDPVTGTASGALGAYLVRHRAAAPLNPIRINQGDACGRPGEARVVVEGITGEPRSVVVGGHAIVSVRGEITLGET